MLEAGAAGYISKDSPADEVGTAIRRVQSGGHYVRCRRRRQSRATLIKGGSGGAPFEQLVAARDAGDADGDEGLFDSGDLRSAVPVAEDREHLSLSLFEKLGVTNDVELTRLAMRYGLLDEKSESQS